MITSNQPVVEASARYSINETCAILCVSRKTLAKYTVAGLIKCGYRKATMKKFYTGLDIMKFWNATA